MGQQEIYDFLKSKRHNRKWYTTNEISEALNVSKGSVSTNLTKLRTKTNFVMFRYRKHAQFEYKYNEVNK